MGIREIDDRYPEFARPYEPIKGRHKHKKLILPSGLLMSVAGMTVILSSAAFGRSLPPPLPPEDPGGGSYIAAPDIRTEPSPEISSVPSPETTETPEPETSETPEPETSETPEPETSETPEPKRTDTTTQINSNTPVYYPTTPTSPSPDPTPATKTPAVTVTGISNDYPDGRNGVSFTFVPNDTNVDSVTATLCDANGNPVSSVSPKICYWAEDMTEWSDDWIVEDFYDLDSALVIPVKVQFTYVSRDDLSTNDLESGLIYLYGGDYAFEGSVWAPSDSELVASFPLDTYYVPGSGTIDVAKSSLFIYGDEVVDGEYSIESVNVSDGNAVVTIDLFDEHSLEDVELIVTFSYSDPSRGISNWTCTAGAWS